MKLLKLLYRRELRIPVLALTFATVVCVTLVSARIVWTQHIRYAFLVWNLFLAWLPLVFSLVAYDLRERGHVRNWQFFSAALAWLIFFPNAPYIFTDLIHLQTRFLEHFWVDMVLILLCALTGLVLGFVSLYLMQSVVTRMLGRLTSWLFILVVTGLSGFGIYLGRFLRLNSWDIVLRPTRVYHHVENWAADPLASSTSAAFPVLFAVFLFIAYLMLYGLTHLQPTHLTPTEIGHAKAANS